MPKLLSVKLAVNLYYNLKDKFWSLPYLHIFFIIFIYNEFSKKLEEVFK